MSTRRILHRGVHAVFLQAQVAARAATTTTTLTQAHALHSVSAALGRRWTTAAVVASWSNSQQFFPLSSSYADQLRLASPYSTAPPNSRESSTSSATVASPMTPKVASSEESKPAEANNSNVTPVTSELQDDMRIMKSLVSDSIRLEVESQSTSSTRLSLQANHLTFPFSGALLMVRVE